MQVKKRLWEPKQLECTSQHSETGCQQHIDVDNTNSPAYLRSPKAQQILWISMLFFYKLSYFVPHRIKIIYPTYFHNSVKQTQIRLDFVYRKILNLAKLNKRVFSPAPSKSMMALRSVPLMSIFLTVPFPNFGCSTRLPSSKFEVSLGTKSPEGIEFWGTGADFAWALPDARAGVAPCCDGASEVFFAQAVGSFRIKFIDDGSALFR